MSICEEINEDEVLFRVRACVCFRFHALFIK